MREPDLHFDGWCLDDGEEYRRSAPDTFWIPTSETRERLQPGDYVKLIFRISVNDPDTPTAVERMWVLVRERKARGYLGILSNDPSAIEENNDLWSGIELPFTARHIIDIVERDELSIARAAQEPKRRWRA
ncbi:UNVERIFIED_ORG: hypothetical protein J2W85_002132 [Ensifer adhaerens]|nr:hypothetical protein [Ensifer adhaerens]